MPIISRTASDFFEAVCVNLASACNSEETAGRREAIDSAGTKKAPPNMAELIRKQEEKDKARKAAKKRKTEAKKARKAPKSKKAKKKKNKTTEL